MNKLDLPLVSVVIPAFNAEDFLTEAIESILAQSYENLECIIIDDCSTDSSRKIIQRFCLADPRVKAFYNEINLGIGGNRKKGIQLARGDFICWQDADDISLPQRIERQVEYLQANPSVGVVGGYIEFFGDGIKTSTRAYAQNDKDLRKKIFRYNPVAQPASMVRKACYEEVGSFNEALDVSEDLEMLFRIGTKYKFANIQQVVLRYRQTPGSLTATKLRRMEIMTLRIRHMYARKDSYSPTIFDLFYNIAQFASIFLIPSSAKIAIFNRFRNSN